MTPDDEGTISIPSIDSLPEEALTHELFQSLKLDFRDDHDSSDQTDESVAGNSAAWSLRRISITRHDVIEHIFSHVKHYMHVSHHIVTDHGTGPDGWESHEGRQLRWMTMEELTQVGITTGVKKALQAVQGVGKNKTKRKTSRTAASKVEEAAREIGIADKKQRTLKDFF